MLGALKDGEQTVVSTIILNFEIKPFVLMCSFRLGTGFMRSLYCIFIVPESYVSFLKGGGKSVISLYCYRISRVGCSSTNR